MTADLRGLNSHALSQYLPTHRMEDFREFGASTGSLTLGRESNESFLLLYFVRMYIHSNNVVHFRDNLQ